MADNKIGVEIVISGNAEAQLGKIIDGTKKVEVAFSSGFFNAGRAFDSFVGNIAALKVDDLLHVVESAAHTLFETFIVDGVKAAEQMENSQNQLNQALASQGKYTKEASDGLASFANHLQATSKFSDDAVLSAAALIENIVALDEKGLKVATQGAADLAAAYGVDLESASRAVGKALEGNTTSLRRFGMDVEAGATQAQTMANVLEALKAKQGAAEAQTKTFSGATTQVAHTFEDFQKAMGESIVKNVAVVNGIQEVNAVFRELLEKLFSNKQAVREFIAEGFIKLIDVSAAVVIGLDGIYRTGVIVFESLKAGAETVALVLLNSFPRVVADLDEMLSKLPGIGDKFGGLHTELDKLSESLKNSIAEDSKSLIDAFNNPTKASQGVLDALGRIRDKAVEGFDAVKKGAEAGVDPANQLKKALQELSAEQQRLGDEGKKLADQNSNPVQQKEAQLALMRASQEETFTSWQTYFDKERELQAMKYEEEQALLEKALQQRKISQEEYNAAMATLDVKNQTAMRKIHNDQRAQEIKDQETFLNTAKTLSSAKSKELAMIGKAAALTQIAIQTPPAIAASFNFGAQIGGPPLGFVFAAIAAAAEAAQAAAVMGIPLATGIDEVPPGFQNDTFPARLSSGERVVPKNTNEQLKTFLNDSNGLKDILISIDSKIARLSNEITVQIGDRVIVNEIRSALQAGRVLAL